MFLQRLRIVNFRGFYGEQVVEFAPVSDKPVTIIHGENGAGKTNLLNAVFWCLTGLFTPRLSNPEMLINKAARDEDKEAACLVEINFSHEDREYLLRRTVIRRGESNLELFHIEDDTQKLVPKPQLFMERIIPKGLSRWFFFDAEAIGELELSGSEQFKRELRRVLGFELVDALVEDLERCLSKKQRNLVAAVNSKELDQIQSNIENIEHVLPNQRIKSDELGKLLQDADANVSRIERELQELPKSRPLQEQRSKLDARRKNRVVTRKELQEQIARFTGESAPAVLLAPLASPFEDQLHVKENTGRLPAPYSEQLVEDILHEGMCVCGREVAHDSCEEAKIRSLLRNASTSAFNNRIRSIQYLLKDIQAAREGFSTGLNDLQRRLAETDTEVADIDDELKQIKQQLEQIDEESIRSLENERNIFRTKSRELVSQISVLQSNITNNEAKLKDLRLRYENTSKRLGHGDTVRKEIDKIKRLSDYIAKTLQKQEHRALQLLQIELNRILARYLTKHFQARINAKTYEVEMLDAQGRQVGRSTGESQVLKFAFITTVVALAGRKTQEKIDFMAEPTIAPLMLDAPFSALDPEYQSSVAENLANQSSQLILLLSSAAWGDSVEKALNPHIGRRYVLISHQAGPRGNKPIKTMKLNGKTIPLNKYETERDESVVLEL
jgi:DNA sulfur modification protein DndD